MAVDADGNEADDCERQQVVADKERDEDPACCRYGDRQTDVPHLRAICRQYRGVDDGHTDPYYAYRQQDVTASSQPARVSK